MFNPFRMKSRAIYRKKRPKFDFQQCEPVCRCLPRYPTSNKRNRQPVVRNIIDCDCGDPLKMEWLWEAPSKTFGTVQISLDGQQVTFHPTYSNGTALVKGSRPLVHDYQYYWEIKVMSECYGTDIMIGVGSDVFNSVGTEYKFHSLLGCNGESYGMSYHGGLCHDERIFTGVPGFRIGDIVGIKLDMWHGALKFYVNRQHQAVEFFNMRRHKQMFPMITSTAAQSTYRLIYTGSWKASLLTAAAKMLTPVYPTEKKKLPISIQKQLEENFWIMYSEGTQ